MPDGLSHIQGSTTMRLDCINLPSLLLLAKFYLDIAQILSHPSLELILEQVRNAKLLEIVSNIGQEMPIEHVQRSSLVHNIAPCNNVHPGHIGACSLCKLTIAYKFIQQHSQRNIHKDSSWPSSSSPAKDEIWPQMARIFFKRLIPTYKSPSSEQENTKQAHTSLKFVVYFICFFL